MTDTDPTKTIPAWLNIAAFAQTIFDAVNEAGGPWLYVHDATDYPVGDYD